MSNGAGIDARLGERAAEKLLGGDHAVLRVEEYAVEAFVAQVLHAQPQVAAYRGGRGEAVARPHLLGEGTPRQLHHRGDPRVPGRPDPGNFAELARRGGKHARKPAEALQQLAGHGKRAPAAHAGSEEERDELRVRERRRSPRQQSFAGPLGERPAGLGHADLDGE